MHTIENIIGVEIQDSRGNPTLLVTVTTDTGFTGSFAVPSGASTGMYEAHELRDDESGHGGLQKACTLIISEILPQLRGISIFEQTRIDDTLLVLDGTKQKTRLGGNTLIGVSIACAKAAAAAKNIPVYAYLRSLSSMSPSRKVPYIYFNLINGGKHAHTHLAFHEYHIVPQVESVAESLRIASRVQEALAEIITSEYGDVVKGDEGGYALPETDSIKPLLLLQKAAEKVGHTEKIAYALDVAASSFFDSGHKRYLIAGELYERAYLADMYKKIITEFPFVSIEDPFMEEDFSSFATLQAELAPVRIVGDDLTVTNIEKLTEAVDHKSITGIIIKPNQIGTLSETIKTMEYARSHGIDCIVSHRSGETLDDFIADLAYAFRCFGIKSGARGPAEREVKYGRLQIISEQE